MSKIDTMEQSKFNNVTYQIDTADGSMFVSIVETDAREPLAIHISIGKAGAAIASWANALSNTLTLALDRGAGINDLIAELSSITSDRVRTLEKGEAVRSAPEAVCVVLMRYRKYKYHELTRTLDGRTITEDDGRPVRLGNGDFTTI